MQVHTYRGLKLRYNQQTPETQPPGHVHKHTTRKTHTQPFTAVTQQPKVFSPNQTNPQAPNQE